MPVINLSKDEVVERWDILITDATGQGERIIADVIRRLEQSKVPDVITERRHVAAGMMQGILGGKRPFVVVRHTSNPNLKPFNMYINTRDHGTYLQVSWFLVFQPSGWSQLINFVLTIPILSLLIYPFYLISRLAASREAGVLALNLFDEQDLRAYVTFAHQCLLDTIEQLLHEEQIEMPKINKRSTGFLGIV